MSTYVLSHISIHEWKISYNAVRVRAHITLLGFMAICAYATALESMCTERQCSSNVCRCLVTVILSL